MIVLGADTHKSSHSVAAADAATGELVGEKTIAVGRGGFVAVLNFDADYKSAMTAVVKSENFAKFPELRWLNKYHFIPPTVLGVSLYLIGGLPLFLWAFCLSTVLLWHDTFTINSLSHLFGTVRYETTDTSKNNWFLALLTLGEGWHNNHHHYQSAARQGFFHHVAEVYLCFVKVFCAVVEVLRVYKNADTLAFVFNDCHKNTN